MARNKGNLNFSGNFEIKSTAPIDARTIVPTVLELTESSTWIDEDSKIWLYDGLVVSVLENHGLYMLKNYDPVSNPSAYSDADNWIRIDASAAKIDVVDNLTSTDSTKALAASQGKTLNDKIENLKTSLSSVYNYKGTVTDFESLPSDPQKGDVYNVTTANGNIPAGTNYAWTGTDWDPLGGSIDLSGYYTKDEVDQAINGASGDLTDELNTLKQTVQQNSSKLTVLNGNEDTAGSLSNTLKLAKDYTDTQLTGYVEKVEGSSLISSEKLQLIDTNASEIATLKTSVEANTAALNILNGDGDTAGSVLNTVNNNIKIALDWKEL